MIKNLHRLVLVLALLVGTLLIMRIGWFVVFKPDLNGSLDLTHAFITGLRFDLAAASYGLLIPLLLLPFFSMLVPKWQDRLTFFFLYIFTLLILVINISDIAFYSYFREHINLLFFGLVEDDTKAVLITIWKEYNVLLHIIWLSFFFYIHFKVFKKIFSLVPNRQRDPIYKSSLFFLMILIIFALLGRGNLNDKPLSYEEAHFSNNAFVNHIALNGVFAFYRAVKVRSKLQSSDFDLIKELGFKGRELEAFKILYGIEVNTIKEGLDYLVKKAPVNIAVQKRKPNIVIILAESFGGDWLKYQSPKLNFLASLEKHLKEDYYFENGLSAENGTIGSLVSLIVGQVYRPNSVVLSESRYSFTPMKSAIHLPFQKEGYKTTFFYGGKLGWRDIGRYVHKQGYEEIYGQKYLLDKFQVDDVGNEWGVFDQFLLEASLDQLKNSEKPVFQLIMTTSNHPPYDVPKNYQPWPLELPENLKDRLARGYDYSMKRFKAFQYANNELGNYLTKIKESTLGENTIVVFSGDHNFWGITIYNENETFMKHKVPYYFYIPKNYQIENISYDAKKFISNHDLLASIAPFALSETEYMTTGRNIFQEKSFATNSSGLIADETGMYLGNDFFEWKEQVGGKVVRSKNNLKELKEKYNALLTITELFLRSQKESTRKD